MEACASTCGRRCAARRAACSPTNAWPRCGALGVALWCRSVALRPSCHGHKPHSVAGAAGMPSTRPPPPFPTTTPPHPTHPTPHVGWQASQVEVRSACGKLDDEQCRLDCFAQAEDPGDVIDSPEPPPCPCTKEWAPGEARNNCSAASCGVAAGCMAHAAARLQHAVAHQECALRASQRPGRRLPTTCTQERAPGSFAAQAVAEAPLAARFVQGFAARQDHSCCMRPLIHPPIFAPALLPCPGPRPCACRHSVRGQVRGRGGRSGDVRGRLPPHFCLHARVWRQWTDVRRQLPAGGEWAFRVTRSTESFAGMSVVAFRSLHPVSLLLLQAPVAATHLQLLSTSPSATVRR